MPISYFILDRDIIYQYFKDERRKMITYIMSCLKILQSSTRSLLKYENVKQHRFESSLLNMTHVLNATYHASNI